MSTTILSSANLAWDLTRRDLAQRYRGTVLGAFWPFLYGALSLLIFTYVFSVVLKVRWPVAAGDTPASGALMIFAGLVPYLFVAEVISRAPASIVSVPNFVKKVRFPLRVLPVVVVGSAMLLSLVNAGLLVIAAGIARGGLPATAWLLPLAYLPLGLFALACAFALSSLGVFFRDLGQISPLVAQLLMFLAPVCYPLEQVPDSVRAVVDANPLTYFTGVFRGLVLQGTPLQWDAWIMQTLLWSGLLVLAAWLFRRTRPMFADLL